MVKKILLNNHQKHFTKRDLPLLIHGAEGSGGSLFSITIVADLCALGAKVLFISGYHMARDEFIEQTSISDYVVVERESDNKLTTQKQVIFVARKRYDLFAELVKTLPDIDDRIIFIKNLELFDKDVVDLTKNLSNIVIAGDIDKYSSVQQILDKNWKTQVLFSETANILDYKIPKLPKYTGYLKNKQEARLVSVE